MTQLATVITGASSGIGMELAHLFAPEHQHLVLVARRREPMDALAADLKHKYGVRVTVISRDLQEPGAAQALMDDLAAHHLQVDTLVNNAGFGLSGNFAHADPVKTSAMMQLNMITLTELTQRALPGMLERGQGRILNVASLVAFQSCPYFAIYAATKSFVLSFSEALAEEVGSRGVLVSCLCPGSTDTGFHDVAATKGSVLEQIADSPKMVAEQGYKGLNNGQRVVVTGWMNKPVPMLNRLVPRRAMTWAVGKVLGR